MKSKRMTLQDHLVLISDANVTSSLDSRLAKEIVLVNSTAAECWQATMTWLERGRMRGRRLNNVWAVRRIRRAIQDDPAARPWMYRSWWP
jgi:hypothetical protein